MDNYKKRNRFSSSVRSYASHSLLFSPSLTYHRTVSSITVEHSDEFRYGAKERGFKFGFGLEVLF